MGGEGGERGGIHKIPEILSETGDLSDDHTVLVVITSFHLRLSLFTRFQLNTQPYFGNLTRIVMYVQTAWLGRPTQRTVLVNKN